MPVTTPRDLGSAITYGKRYQLVALLGLSADVDDDAGAVSQSKHNWGQKLSKEQSAIIQNFVKDNELDKEKYNAALIGTFGEHKGLKDMTSDDANLFIKYLKDNYTKK